MTISNVPLLEMLNIKDSQALLQQWWWTNLWLIYFSNTKEVRLEVISSQWYGYIFKKRLTCSTSQAKASNGGNNLRYSCSMGYFFWVSPGICAPRPSAYSTREWRSSQAATLVCLSLDCCASFTTWGRKGSVWHKVVPSTQYRTQVFPIAGTFYINRGAIILWQILSEGWNVSTSHVNIITRNANPLNENNCVIYLKIHVVLHY